MVVDLVTKQLDSGISKGKFEPVILNNKQKWIDGEAFPKDTYLVNPDFSIVKMTVARRVQQEDLAV
jgi:hypothetical protein